MSANNAAAVELCNAGIAQKRAGNYQAALDYYTQAERLDRGFAQVYMNKGKLLLGCGYYAHAFSNLMTYGHLHMVDKVFNNAKAKHVVENSSIPATYSPGKSYAQAEAYLAIQGFLKAEDGQRFFWQTYGEINLTRFAGACIWAQQPEKAARFVQEIDSIKNMVMGYGGNIGDEANADMQTTGFIYLTRNYKKAKLGIFGTESYDISPEKIPALYLTDK